MVNCCPCLGPVARFSFLPHRLISQYSGFKFWVCLCDIGCSNMSDGGEDSERENKQDLLLQRAHPDDYGRAVSQVAVAQICEGFGFDFVKKSALEALSDVAVRYICELGKSASLYASLAGRSEVNIFDIVKGLEDLSSASNFSGALEVNRCVAGSAVVKEMADFMMTMEENPFAQPIPRFPVVKCQRVIPCFSQMGEIPSGKHIPDWLPALPDPHTYIHSPIWNDRKTDPRNDKAEQVRQRRKAERSLLNLQQRLLSNGLAGPSGSGRYHVDVSSDLGTRTENNPFIAPPLPAGEKEVSTMTLPAKMVTEEDDKKCASVFETFGPAIEAIKGGISDPMELDQQVTTPPERRPVVHFKLKAGKKMLVEDLDVNLRNCMKGRKASWLERDDDKDDKKRKAELILRQSMENAQDLSQM